MLRVTSMAIQEREGWQGWGHLDVGHPAMVVGLKGHPALIDLARPRHVPQHLLHVDVLVPVASNNSAIRHCCAQDGGSSCNLADNESRTTHNSSVLCLLLS